MSILKQLAQGVRHEILFRVGWDIEINGILETPKEENRIECQAARLNRDLLVLLNSHVTVLPVDDGLGTKCTKFGAIMAGLPVPRCTTSL